MAQHDSTTGNVTQFPRGRRARPQDTRVRPIPHTPLPQRQIPTIYEDLIDRIGRIVETVVLRETNKVREELRRHIEATGSSIPPKGASKKAKKAKPDG